VGVKSCDELKNGKKEIQGKKQGYQATHTHPFNGPLSGTTWVSRNQKVKPIWILLKQQIMSGSGISWAICKSAPRSRQITMPVPHHSVLSSQYKSEITNITVDDKNVF